MDEASLGQIIKWAKMNGHKLRGSERKKLTAILKKRGVKGKALRELQFKISMGLTK